MTNILLAEDDRTIASGLEYSLQSEGYGVFLCYDVKSAVQALESETIDLCLLDVSLPDGSGYDICRKAKQARDLPVIFLTACDEEVNVVMGLDMGADDYIVKPFRIRELLSRIHSVLRRSQSLCSRRCHDSNRGGKGIQKRQGDCSHSDGVPAASDFLQSSGKSTVTFAAAGEYLGCSGGFCQ